MGFSGAKITKGDLFLVFTMGGAKGEKPTSQVCSLRAAAAFVANVVQRAGDKFSAQKVAGFKALPKDLQLKATALLTASSGKKRLASANVATSAKRVKKVTPQVSARLTEIFGAQHPAPGTCSSWMYRV